MPLWIYITFVLMMMFVRIEGQRCPCPCDKAPEGGLRMNCNRKSVIPIGFPVSTLVINLQHNKVSKVLSNNFAGLVKMTLLRLDANRITKVEPKAFYGLSSLNDLFLSVNQIETIPDDLVDPAAPLLKGIKLNTNKLKTFPLNLLMRTRKLVAVRDNPIICDCFAVIPHELKSKAVGTCVFPEKLKNREINSITYSDVNCVACTSKECIHGSCYMDNGIAACLCFTGYFGDSCELGSPLITDNAATTTIEVTTSIQETSTEQIITTLIPDTTHTVITTPDFKTTSTPNTTSKQSTHFVSSVTTNSTTKKSNVDILTTKITNKSSDTSPFKIKYLILSVVGCTILIITCNVCICYCYVMNKRKKRNNNNAIEPDLDTVIYEEIEFKETQHKVISNTSLASNYTAPEIENSYEIHPNIVYESSPYKALQIDNKLSNYTTLNENTLNQNDDYVYIETLPERNTFSEVSSSKRDFSGYEVHPDMS